jgi:hypothetical protein
MNVGTDPGFLRLRSSIDAGYLERIAPALQAIFYQRLIAQRARFQFFRQYRYRAMVAVKCLSALGLALSLVFIATGGLRYQGARVDLAFLLFFGLMLALAWNPRRMTDWLATPSRPYWSGLAKRHTNTLLKKARASVPFVAEYELRGDLIVYFRLRGGRAEVAWTRRLHGHRLGGDGFTLLYKMETSVAPYMIILHAAPDALDTHLDGLGIGPLAPPD